MLNNNHSLTAPSSLATDVFRNELQYMNKLTNETQCQRYSRAPFPLRFFFFLSPDAFAPVIRGGSQIHASESDDRGGESSSRPTPPLSSHYLLTAGHTARSWKEVRDGLRQKKAGF